MTKDANEPRIGFTDTNELHVSEPSSNKPDTNKPDTNKPDTNKPDTNGHGSTELTSENQEVLQLEIDLRDPEVIDLSDLAGKCSNPAVGTSHGEKLKLELEAAALTEGTDLKGACLTELETQILAFEHRWFQRRGVKHVVLSQEFGISPIRYYQILNQVIDKPAAVISDPTLVNRLRRVRDSRRQAHGAMSSVLRA